MLCMVPEIGTVPKLFLDSGQGRLDAWQTGRDAHSASDNRRPAENVVADELAGRTIAVAAEILGDGQPQDGLPIAAERVVPGGLLEFFGSSDVALARAGSILESYYTRPGVRRRGWAA